MRGNKPMLGLLHRLDLPGRERLAKDVRLAEIELQPGGCVSLESDAHGGVVAYEAEKKRDVC